MNIEQWTEARRLVDENEGVTYVDPRAASVPYGHPMWGHVTLILEGASDGGFGCEIDLLYVIDLAGRSELISGRRNAA